MEQLPHKPRRDDPEGHMVVQKNVEALFDAIGDGDAKFLRGSTSIINPSAFVDVSHAYGSAAYAMMVIPTSNPGAVYWVSNKTTTSFRINLPTAPVGTVTFEWFLKGD